MSNSPNAAEPVAARAHQAGPLRVRVWDLPLRLFHWLLVLCLIGSFATIKTGLMEWHFRFGYAALGLIVFRILWGLAGPRYARFSSFVYSPRATFAYLSNASQAPRTLGHTPMGALSVFALLAIVAIQAGAGLFTSDDIASEGPLARLASNAFVAQASWLHHFNEPVILGLVGLHLAAILYYRVFGRQSLVKPMVVGDKLLAPDPAHPDPSNLAARDDLAVRLRAVAVAVFAAAIVAAVVNWPLV